MPALVVGYLESREVPEGEITTGTHGDEVTIEATIPGERQPTLFVIRARGTHFAFDPDDSGIDIGMASREITESEAVALRSSRGNPKDPAAERAIGRDGLAIVVHEGLAVPPLSLDQLRDIFTCDDKAKTWSQMGANSDDPIKVITMNGDSGTNDHFKKEVLPDDSFCPDATQVRDGRQVDDEVRRTRGAIGFVPLPFTQLLQGSTEQPLPVVPIYDEGTQPLTPSRFTVATESYRLRRRLFLYLFQKPTPRAAATALVDFAAKDDRGKKIVEDHGFAVPGRTYPPPSVPALRVAAGETKGPAEPEATTSQSTPLICKNPPQEYVSRVRGATQRTTDIRFEFGSETLDNTAKQDLEALVADLNGGPAAGKKVVLVGFVDSRGIPEVNIDISRRRAEAVGRTLQVNGIGAELAWYGKECPTDTSETEAGWQHNRRVEIWLKD